ncbi:MAG TPA: Rieske 2Fe-2S domain-containing protein [Vicinamibacterales bacterium]|nr:Rieske 2Fe-2S domain-containing protein [Vicinamibacterales bacterium]
MPVSPDGREPIDARIDTPGREGLTGTAPANLYTPPADREQITLGPDWRPLDEQPVWRQDFPIDAPQDHHVARRDFMKFMVLTSCAFTVGQFWIAAQNWLRRRRGRPPIRPVARLGEIPVGGALTFRYPGEHDACILLRPSANLVVAFSQQCTHLACAVIPRMEQGHLYCPCHEGIFDAVSGRPLAGPPRRPLARIVLDIRGETIYATGVERRTV